MDLTMVDLGLLADPLRCLEAEPAALEIARFFAELPATFDGGLPAEQVLARTTFIRAVVTHWPDGPTRPLEVTRLVERYGESGAADV